MHRAVVSFFFCTLLSIFPFSSFLRADCSQDYRSEKKGGLLITDLVLIGGSSASTTQLNAIRQHLVGVCMNDDSEELGERIKALLRDRGYFTAEVKNLKISPIDPLAVPKPAAVEADVLEGPQFRFGEVRFCRQSCTERVHAPQRSPDQEGGSI